MNALLAAKLNPQTPYELMVAFSDPNSPLSKEFFNLIKTEVDISQFRIKLLERLIYLNEQVKQADLANAYRDDVAASKLRDQTIYENDKILQKQNANDVAFTSDTSVENKSVAKSLRADAQSLLSQLKALSQQMRESDQLWKDQQLDLAKQITQQLKDQNLNIICNGQELSQEATASIILQAVPVASPSRLKQINPDLFDRMVDEFSAPLEKVIAAPELAAGVNADPQDAKLQSASIGLSSDQFLELAHLLGMSNNVQREFKFAALALGLINEIITPRKINNFVKENSVLFQKFDVLLDVNSQAESDFMLKSIKVAVEAVFLQRQIKSLNTVATEPKNSQDQSYSKLGMHK